MEIIDIKGIRAKPGEKAFGFLEVGSTSINTYRIPVTVINGAKDGKTLCLLGGTHGTEFASIEGVIRTVQNLDPKQMNGAVLAVTVLNGPQFEHRSAFLSPFDQLNQNRQFPGNPEGTLSQRTAHMVFSEIVPKADALIDAHGGDITEDIDCMVIADQGEKEDVNKVAIEMASCFPTKYITTHKVGQIAGSSGIAMEKFGIPCVTSEAGTPYPVRERHIKFHYDGIMNNLKYFGILKGKPVMSNPVINPKSYRFRAKQGGIWHSKVELEQFVSAGQEIGNMTDLFGNVLETYKAQEDSMVTFLRVFYSVNVGEQLIGLVVLK
jgi:uncharacterized protein